ncbi:MAG: LysR substrate-binding domain-containing protein [Planctomycetota bacterium]
MRERPSIRQLEYLVALADTLNFRRAAERCFVSQPALSAQIQKLEEMLGASLFERDSKKVLPTPVGLSVADHARRVLREADGLLDVAESFEDPLAGSIRLGVIPTLAPYVLPKVLPQIRRKHESLSVWIREDRTDELLAALQRGELDVLLLALDPDLGDVESLLLFDEAFVVATPQNHPFADRENVREEDLAGEQVLLLEDGHCMRATTLSVCHDAGACEVADFRASSLTTLVQMVGNGIGITLLPESAVEIESRRAEVVVVPFVDPPPTRRIGLAWRRGSSRGNGFRALGEMLEAGG